MQRVIFITKTDERQILDAETEGSPPLPDVVYVILEEEAQAPELGSEPPRQAVA